MNRYLIFGGLAALGLVAFSTMPVPARGASHNNIFKSIDQPDCMTYVGIVEDSGADLQLLTLTEHGFIGDSDPLKDLMAALPEEDGFLKPEGGDGRIMGRTDKPEPLGDPWPRRSSIANQIAAGNYPYETKRIRYFDSMLIKV